MTGDRADEDRSSGAGSDPRLAGKRTRTVAATGGDRAGPGDEDGRGTVTLVGVVHEHPASAHRAATVARERDPAVLALELPPIALPLFVAHAGDDRSPPAFGGEMTGAIRAARTDRVVGIDGPSLGFLGQLVVTLVGDSPDATAIRGVCRGIVSATREAIACGVAGAVAVSSSRLPSVGESVDHDCTHEDAPSVQATDEDRQIRRARAIMDLAEPSRASQFRDEIREAHMADRLSALRQEGDVVAVVGYGHLDALGARLREETS